MTEKAKTTNETVGPDAKKRVLVMNGPNLNLLGRREPDIYGSMTLDELQDVIAKMAAGFNIEVDFYQSNYEGGLIERLHQAYLNTSTPYDAVILNAGAYTHTSLALRDAIAAVKPLPVIEVHISRVAAREDFRHTSLIAPVCAGSICGFGLRGYLMALLSLTLPNLGYMTDVRKEQS